MSTLRDEQKEGTRDRLYSVAMRLFQRRGYDNVSIDDVVRASKVARGTFYFHYPKKDDVLLEAIRRGETQIVAHLRALRAPHTLERSLKATTDAFAEVWGDRRELLSHAGSVALRRIASVPTERDVDPLRLELTTHLARAIDVGELATVLPPAILADTFLLQVFAGLMAWSAMGEPALEVMMPAVVDLFLNGAKGFGR
ncbi:MAG: TetR/AcrR family transcriptional regulator [Polyangiales bacterium]